MTTPASRPLAMLSWTAQPPDRRWLSEHRFASIDLEAWRREFVARAQAVGVARSTLDSPAAALLARYRQHQGVALTNVRLGDLQALRDLHGYALEPAWRAGCRLIVHADRTLEQLDPAALVDEDFGYAWTLERARFLAGVMSHALASPAAAGDAAPAGPLDAGQREAVAAHDGVVQVIAPAGSGKTTVLIERVRELLRHGVPAQRILCVTFNAAAAEELRDRLAAAGVTSVQARTFHSTGRWLLKEEGLLRGEPRPRTPAQWRRLVTIAQREAGGDGVWLDPADARTRISELKLGQLLTAAEWRRRAPADPDGQTLAALYSLYEREFERVGCHDFDDHIFLAVRALRSDPGLRARWQGRFDRVLVDEYQDIEPAQELLVQILAAPQDSLFVVGDPDQLLYGWRRASAARMVTLDQTYPGLERCALQTNYRCPPVVVEHASKLIAHNTIRFPQQIQPAPGRAARNDVLELHEDTSTAAGRWVADQLAASRRGQIVVLARTTRLLRTVAWACVQPGVAISAPPEVFESSGAHRVIRAHLQLAAHPDRADAEDVLAVMRHPSRGLQPEAEITVAQHLREGMSWKQATRGLDDRRGRIAEAAELLDTLHAITDAARFVRALRTTGGLDRHFEEYERTSGATEQVHVETLQDAERDAAGLTVEQYADRLRDQHDRLQAIRDDEHGIELTTVHRAKGREWPTVIVFGFDDDQLPHARALQVTAEQRAAGEGLEAERRIAYVALTRAKERLHIVAAKGKMSPFAWQAGLAPEPPPPASAPEPARRHTPSRPPRDLASQIDTITRVGAKYAVRTAPDQRTGLRVAAWAIRRGLVNAANVAGSTTARDYVNAVPEITDTNVDALLVRADVDGHAVISRMPAHDRARLADVLDAEAVSRATS
jgi:DNA helicase-2/ATP-dependent DNA helicase PcrA